MKIKSRLLRQFIDWVNADEAPEGGYGQEELRVSNVEQIPNPWRDDSHNYHLRFKDRLYNYSRTVEAWRLYKVIYRTVAITFCLLLCLVMLMTVSNLPPYGEASNPANNEVVERYIEKGLEETGATNFVAGMILDYRAFDTLGESNVLFIAVCSVMILLRKDKNKKTGKNNIKEMDPALKEHTEDTILSCVASIAFPIIVLFGIYVILNGHLSAGGGFSGGAIIGGGLILYSNAFGDEKISRFFTEKTYRWVSFFALLTYASLKFYSFFTGANHLESGIPLGTPGTILSSGLILPLNICVGCVVACTMYAFYSFFRKGAI